MCLCAAISNIKSDNYFYETNKSNMLTGICCLYELIDSIYANKNT